MHVTHIRRTDHAHNVSFANIVLPADITIQPSSTHSTHSKPGVALKHAKAENSKLKYQLNILEISLAKEKKKGGGGGGAAADAAPATGNTTVVLASPAVASVPAMSADTVGKWLSAVSMTDFQALNSFAGHPWEATLTAGVQHDDLILLGMSKCTDRKAVLRRTTKIAANPFGSNGASAVSAAVPAAAAAPAAAAVQAPSLSETDLVRRREKQQAAKHPKQLKKVHAKARSAAASSSGGPTGEGAAVATAPFTLKMIELIEAPSQAAFVSSKTDFMKAHMAEGQFKISNP